MIPKTPPRYRVWQPMESAPKDGTKVLMYFNGRYLVAWWHGDLGWYSSGNNVPKKVQHWMPLPAPPSDPTP